MPGARRAGLAGYKRKGKVKAVSDPIAEGISA